MKGPKPIKTVILDILMNKLSCYTAVVVNLEMIVNISKNPGLTVEPTNLSPARLTCSKDSGGFQIGED